MVEVMGEDVVFGYWKEGEIIYPTRVFSIENPRTRAPGAPGPGVHVTRMRTEGGRKKGVTLTGGRD